MVFKNIGEFNMLQISKKRLITPENCAEFIAALEQPRFSEFHQFAFQIKKAMMPNMRCNSTTNYQSQADGLKDISNEMKKLDKDLYKRLTSKVYDSNKKSKTTHTVKINKEIAELAYKMHAHKSRSLEQVINLIVKHHILYNERPINLRKPLRKKCPKPS